MLKETAVTIKIYADDIKIYTKITASEDAERLQTAIDCVLGWSKLWQLPLSPQKTIFMHLSHNSASSLNSYSVDGVPISSVDSVRERFLL